MLKFVSIFLINLFFCGNLFAATIANDTFTEGSDVNPISGHTPSPAGTAWTVTGNGCRIEADTDTVEGDGTSIEMCKETTDIGDDDMDVSIDIAAFSSNSGQRVGACGRIPSGETGESNSYCGYGVGDGAAIDLALIKRVATVESSLGTFDANIGSGDLPDTLKLKLRTSSQILQQNGTDRITATDSDISGNNFAGIIMQRAVMDGDNFLSESVAAGGIKKGLVMLIGLFMPQAFAAEDYEWFESDICNWKDEELSEIDSLYPCILKDQTGVITNFSSRHEIVDGKYWVKVTSPKSKRDQLPARNKVREQDLPLEIRR